MSKLLWVVACVGVAVHGFVLAQEEVEETPPGVDAVRKERAELDKQITDLRTKMNARRAAAEKSADAMALKKTMNETRAKADEYVRTDPKLKELEKARQAADNEVNAARERAAAASDEGTAISKERSEIWKNDPVLDYQARLSDFILRNKVQSRINSENDDVRSAAATANGMRWQMDNIRRDIERNNEEITALRAAIDKLRAEHDKNYNASKSKQLKDAWKAYQDAEKAFNEVLASKTGMERKAINQAREAENEVRETKKGADEEASKLMAERQDLQKELARIQYQISEIDFRMRYGVDGRIARDPDVQKAASVRSRLEQALRDRESKDAEIAAARQARDEARKQADSLEQAHRKSDDVVATYNAYRNKENEYKEALNKLVTEQTGELKAQYETAQKAANDARNKAYAADPDASDLSAQIAQINKDRGTARDRDRELQKQWRDLVRKQDSNAEVKAALQAAAEARKAYDEGYKASEATKLRQGADAASRAYSQKINELLGADEHNQALDKQHNELREKTRELDKKLRDLTRPQKEKPPKKAAETK